MNEAKEILVNETGKSRRRNDGDAEQDYASYTRMAREGMRRIRESMKEFKLPEPKWHQEAVHGVVVRVTLRNDHVSRKRATDTDVAQHFGMETWRLLPEHEIKILAYAFRNKEFRFPKRHGLRAVHGIRARRT